MIDLNSFNEVPELSCVTKYLNNDTSGKKPKSAKTESHKIWKPTTRTAFVVSNDSQKWPPPGTKYRFSFSSYFKIHVIRIPMLRSGQPIN